MTTYNIYKSSNIGERILLQTTESLEEAELIMNQLSKTEIESEIFYEGIDSYEK